VSSHLELDSSRFFFFEFTAGYSKFMAAFYLAKPETAAKEFCG